MGWKRKGIKYMLTIFLVSFVLFSGNIIHILTYEPRYHPTLSNISSNNLTLLTLNVGFFGNGQLNEDVAINEFIEMIQTYQPDIIALQEIMNYKDSMPSNYSTVKELAHQLQYHIVTNQNPKQNNRGVAILSRWEITMSYSVDLKTTLSRHRSLVIATILTPNGDITVASTHLQTPRLLGERYQQVKQIISELSTKSSVILMGDFNTPPAATDRAYRLLQKNYLDLWRESGHDSQSGRTWSVAHPLLRVDYIWIENSFKIGVNEVFLISNSNLTDHKGIFAALQI